jgi:hypothetical protein
MNTAESNFTSNRNSMNEGGNAGDIVKQRFDSMKHMADDLRERAQDAFRDKPYLVPVTAGAVGLGVGLLLGSKLTRLLALAAVGTFVKETFGSDIQRITQNLGENIRRRLEEQGEGEGSGV